MSGSFHSGNFVQAWTSLDTTMRRGVVPKSFAEDFNFGSIRTSRRKVLMTLTVIVRSWPSASEKFAGTIPAFSSRTSRRGSLEARSAIIRRYSRIQSAVRDLVRKAGFSTSRGDRRGAYVASNEEILIYARKLAADDVRLAANRQMFGHLFDRVEVTAKAASLIVHGFVEVREEKSGAILFRFNQWGKRQSCSSEKLRAEAIAFDALAKDAERLLAATSAQL